MNTKKLYLLCNAHLDPVWLWEWEEGAAEASATFKIAADLCEKFPNFIFNHNEALLYEWIEEYNPSLFKKIRELVAKKRWHIMGGWFLQPDCNMPSGESFVRQALYGRAYFRKKFGVTPGTAINFDPFGHSRGLVQILRKSGYDSYLFCRPGPDECDLPDDRFVWVGYDGSEILCTRETYYNTQRSKAVDKALSYIKKWPEIKELAMLWGIGNHGGGPSLEDLKKLEKLAATCKERELIHSTPENYFRNLRRGIESMPRVKKSMNPFSQGCYTSMSLVKQAYRRLENMYYRAEKMAAAAALLCRRTYPRDELKNALRDLLFGSFHDILPGTCTQPAANASLRMLAHGEEIAARVAARSFFALCSGQPAAKSGTIPVIVYNPHPYPVKQLVECEFQPVDQNWTGTFTNVTAACKGKPLPTQVEQEESHLPLDWRKKIVFQAELKPSAITRFDCLLHRMPSRPEPALKPAKGKIEFKTRDIRVIVNTRTGLIDSYSAGNSEIMTTGSCLLTAIEDRPDSWGMKCAKFDGPGTDFKLMKKAEISAFSNLKDATPAVRVVEDGPARSVIEALFSFKNSRAWMLYKLPREGTEIEIDLRVYWNEPDTMLKFFLHSAFPVEHALGQTVFGREEFPATGEETAAQSWRAVTGKNNRLCLTCINEGCYGGDFQKTGLRMTLLRSAGFSAHPIGNRQILPSGRHSARMDQGERRFRFWLNGGTGGIRLNSVDREAATRNETPYTLSMFPSGEGVKPSQLIEIDDTSLVMTAAKLAENGSNLVLRLLEPTGRRRRAKIKIPSRKTSRNVEFAPFEIKTFRVNTKTGTWHETDLLEERSIKP